VVEPALEGVIGYIEALGHNDSSAV
jgi:hypothetical protein